MFFNPFTVNVSPFVVIVPLIYAVFESRAFVRSAVGCTVGARIGPSAIRWTVLVAASAIFVHSFLFSLAPVVFHMFPGDGDIPGGLCKHASAFFLALSDSVILKPGSRRGMCHASSLVRRGVAESSFITGWIRLPPRV